MPIRILHIVTYMGRGGLESMLMNYYRYMDRNQVQFDFLVHRDFEADYDQEILSLGGRIHHISRLVPWSRDYRQELKAFFKAHPEYRIVHVHQDCLSSVALQCARECGIPVRIAHAHSSSAVKNIKYPIKLHYRKKISRYATDLFACNETAGKWMFCGEPFQVLNNAVDASRYSFDPEKREKIRAELGIGDQLAVGHVGRFRTEKNHTFLVDVFAALVKQHPDSVLLLAGDGDLQPTIEEKVQKLGLAERVRFLGTCSNVPELLQAMDVFVFPSLYEGLPVTMVEAQAAGVPCVISDQVPTECILTDLVIRKSLQESAEGWAEDILKQQNPVHENTFDRICNAGFDITENAQKLQEFYSGKYNGL